MQFLNCNFTWINEWINKINKLNKQINEQLHTGGGYFSVSSKIWCIIDC